MKRRNIAIIAVLSLAVIGQFISSDKPQTIGSNAPQGNQQPESPSRQSLEPEASETKNSGETATPAPSEQPSTDPTSSPDTSSNPSPETASAEPASTSSPTQDSTVANLLAQLDIEAESSLDYDRDLFRHWVDADGDGCDARREVLISEAVVAPTIGARCDLIGGQWVSAYDGVATGDDSSFDVDHMVPLKEAWQSGAYAWSPSRREAFANDLDLPESLIAVSASSNRSKSDRDPADWLPPAASYRCQYLEAWLKVKVKWELTVDQREFQALRDNLLVCP